ncbi:Modular serine protease [Eumeta japonica]|uniref:Modular serine protease n=1 Tax=Eumeta variegata TaxID=151549 RepID=A0A4C1VDC3_EUMVA|nr:Modular serine protease [Eumeta japonica]
MRSGFFISSKHLNGFKDSDQCGVVGSSRSHVGNCRPGAASGPLGKRMRTGSECLGACAGVWVSFGRLHSFRCDNGQCARADAVCDGVFDCADKTDEVCWTIKHGASLEDADFVFRRKRQAACRKGQWQCRDGSCIAFDGVCDGARDCADGSDETHALCRNLKCQSNWFRCTYGACVDGTAPCNGVRECADGSDELQPRCFNETDGIKSVKQIHLRKPKHKTNLCYVADGFLLLRKIDVTVWRTLSGVLGPRSLKGAPEEWWV